MHISTYRDVYDQKKLEGNLDVNFGRNYQQCSLSVMDTIADPDITFDEKGVCNYYKDFIEARDTQKRKNNSIDDVITKIKRDGKNAKYDCLLGLSGGVDSSYLCHFLKKNGLNPLVVHFDYGWNLDLAVSNIKNLTSQLDLDLYTYVMNWKQFKDLQRSYFKASVLDLDVPADHMIFGALLKTARKFKIKYIISGKNIETEFVLPKSWNYRKFDKINLLNIHKQFGEAKLTDLPAFGFFDKMKYFSIYKHEIIEILDYVDYNKKECKKLLIDTYNWTDYGGKHFENTFTRFYQSYVLPKKFHIEKRKAHLSNLIFAGFISKEQALDELENPPYSLKMISDDFEYVAKKLDFSVDELDNLLAQKNVNHAFYGTDEKLIRNWQSMSRKIKAFFPFLKRI